MCKLPTQAYLRECFEYNPETGILIWAKRPRNHFNTGRGWRTHVSQRSGKIAGCESAHQDGSVYLKVRVNGKLEYVHRIIWKMNYGDIPEHMEVDHLEGKTTDNRINRLRLVDATGNMSNKKLWTRNTSGHYGVYQNKASGTWYVQAWKYGKYYSGGSHPTLDDAVKARDKLEAKLGFHNNHGRA